MAPFFCSTWALSFFFQARLRVKVMPSRRQWQHVELGTR
jgi:hypothetical protein